MNTQTATETSTNGAAPPSPAALAAGAQQAASRKEKARLPDELFVLDKTSLDPKTPRVHSLIIDGRIEDFEFHAGKPLALPFATAMRFRNNNGFVVRDDKGHVYEPLPDTAASGTGVKGGLVIGPGELVCRLDELTTEALYQRAVMLPGGDRIKTPTRQRLIDFIETYREQKIAEANAPVRAARTEAGGNVNEDVEDMGENDLGKLFKDE